MKTEDFERLKTICEKEGFELVTESPKDNDKFFVVKKKDLWEGVEFVDNGLMIRKIKLIEKGLVFYEGGSFNHINECKPSTEEAYIKQLKKEAHERFGEIKDGDEFNFNNIKQKCLIGFKDFVYYKHIDRVLAFGAIIYEKGKWAERVKGRIEVEFFSHCAIANNDFHSHSFHLSVSRGAKQFNPVKAGQFLAEQLEKYLNNEL